MKQLLKIFLLLFFISNGIGYGQDLSNKGKEFWVGYGSHVSMYDNAGGLQASGGGQDMVLYFTSDRDALVKIEIPASGWKDSVRVTANSVSTSNVIPKTGLQDARIGAEGLNKNGIHITSDVPIIAYAHVYNSSISGATLLFPVTTLAREYYSINFEQISNANYSYCYSYVIATEDSTNVEIIPTVNTVNNKAGDTIRVKLNKGEIYNIFGRLTTSRSPFRGEDLTGTKIRSIATPTSPCKRIAVFSGSGKIAITCTSASASSDNYMQQAFPANAWGKKYLTVPTDKLPNNYFRIAVSKPSANVRVNGVKQTTLINNFYYQIQTSAPSIIESDEPIMVSQYISSATMAANGNAQSVQSQCNPNIIGSDGDPEMIYLSPIEQTIQKVTINSTPNARITMHFLNLVIHKNGIKSLKIDGVSPSISSTNHPGDNNFVYFQIPLQPGSHTIQSDSGFNATAYGYGNAESYGYNAGTNVRDLNQYVSIKNKYAVINYPATCREAPFNLSITLPFKPLKLAWNFYSNKDLGNNPDPIYATDGNPIEPDTVIKSPVNDLKDLYVYKLKNNDKSLREFIMTQKGVFPVDVIVNNPTADGCSGEQVIPYDITVYDPPTNIIAPTTLGCLEDTVQLKSTTFTDNIAVSKYLWNINGVVQESDSANFKVKFENDGIQKVGLSIVTNIGCLSKNFDTTVLLSYKPKPQFSPDGSVCLGKSLLVKDKSTINGSGSIEKWIWSYSDQQPADTFLASSTGKSPTKKFNDSLLVVKLDLTTNSGCTNSFTDTLYVKPNPVVSLFLPEICLRDAKANFASLSTIPVNNSLSEFIWNFGDRKSDSIGNIGVGEKVSHLYSDTGQYTVSLSVTSNFGCNSKKDTTFYVNGSYPKASFKVINQSGLCSNLPIVIENTSTVDFGFVGRLKLFWNYDGKRTQPDTIDEKPRSNSSYSKQFANFQDKSKIDIPIKIIVYTGGVCSDSVETTVSLNGSPLDKLKPIESICTNKDKRLLNYADISYVKDVSGTEVYSGKGVIKVGDRYYFDPKIDSGNYLIKHRYTTDIGCYAEDSTVIRVNYTPVIDAGPDMTVLDDTSKQIIASAVGVNMQYKWTPSSYLSNDTILQPLVVNPQTDILYTLSVTGLGNCVETDVFKMTALNMVQPTNTFTPNGDGINDLWKIKYIEKYPDCDVELYSPQGNLMYKINNGKQKAWDGTINGRPMPAGTYYYIINPKNNRKKITGFVTLLR